MSTSPELSTLNPQLLPWWAGGVVPALVPGACLSRALLDSFSEAMDQAGLPLQRQRMRYARQYAVERLAAAHCATDAQLRALALRLFELYQR